MTEFYDWLAPIYHLLYEDWEAAIEAEADLAGSVIQSEWGADARTILDASCGIGTQSLGLASRGYRVTASDLSSGAIDRARSEAAKRGLEISFSVCDMLALHEHHGSGFDVVICAGNAIPHLLSDGEILQALRQMYACIRPGGGCLLTIRQYDQEPRGKNLLKPFGVRQQDNERHIIFQVWDFEGDIYRFGMYFITEDSVTGAISTQVMHSQYYAISPNHLLELMRRAGFTTVKRLDDGLPHPAILVGTRSEE